MVYTDVLASDAQAYLVNQRGPMAARLCEATGLVAEQRAEGLALTDEGGGLTDVAMPSEGTEAHATLLVAEHLAQRSRQTPAAAAADVDDVVLFLAEAKRRFGRYWRRSAREPGGEKELAEVAIQRRAKLRLVERRNGMVWPLPALARFALGDADLRTTTPATLPGIA